jgi:hypothetical protein
LDIIINQWYNNLVPSLLFHFIVGDLIAMMNDYRTDDNITLSEGTNGYLSNPLDRLRPNAAQWPVRFSVFVLI